MYYREQAESSPPQGRCPWHKANDKGRSQGLECLVEAAQNCVEVSHPAEMASCRVPQNRQGKTTRGRGSSKTNDICCADNSTRANVARLWLGGSTQPSRTGPATPAMDTLTRCLRCTAESVSCLLRPQSFRLLLHHTALFSCLPVFPSFPDE